MQDNFSRDAIVERLIKYLDGELSAEDNAAVASLLQEDAAIKDRYDNLVAARDAIRLKGIQQQVRSLHKQYYPLAERQAEPKQSAKILRPSFGNRFKAVASVAAILIFIIGIFVLYEYTTTSNASVFAENFVPYQVPVLRGKTKSDALDSLYNARNFSGVIDSFENNDHKSAKNYFLAALSYLENNDADKAVNTFRQLQFLNSHSPEKYFEEESGYYLALALIKAGKIDEAAEELGKITSNPRHMFYAKAKEISKVSLGILKWKQ